jgi:dTDP-4-dehydrorhamnose reductase
MKILVLGDGLLGSEIVRQTGWDYISRKKDNIDFINDSLSFYLGHYDVILNCLANTDTYSTDKESIYSINYHFVIKLSNLCKTLNKKLIHISTDYVYADSDSDIDENGLAIPAPNFYSYSKLLADEYVMFNNNDYLICRCSFKPKPFPYNKGWIDQYGNFDYVDVIADLVIQLINKNANGLYNVGTEKKTIYQLAKQTNSNIISEFRPNNVPSDISMNIDKLKLML